MIILENSSNAILYFEIGQTDLFEKLRITVVLDEFGRIVCHAFLGEDLQLNNEKWMVFFQGHWVENNVNICTSRVAISSYCLNKKTAGPAVIFFYIIRQQINTTCSISNWVLSNEENLVWNYNRTNCERDA